MTGLMSAIDVGCGAEQQLADEIHRAADEIEAAGAEGQQDHIDVALRRLAAVIDDRRAAIEQARARVANLLTRAALSFGRTDGQPVASPVCDPQDHATEQEYLDCRTCNPGPAPVAAPSPACVACDDRHHEPEELSPAGRCPSCERSAEREREAELDRLPSSIGGLSGRTSEPAPASPPPAPSPARKPRTSPAPAPSRNGHAKPPAKRR